jgi:GT2 family glycosyltransferase
LVRLALVVPLWNQWDCTKVFLESLESAAPRGSYELILVDNGSTDATAAGLKAFRKRLDFRLIRNKRNLGCAPAWNQGVRLALKLKAAWIGILNNDLVLPPGIFERCLNRAEALGWDMVCPATREGQVDYALEDYAASYTRRGFGRNERGWVGWCFFVRAGVFRSLGLFDEGFAMGGCEDDDFARRMQAAGMSLGITGSAFVHHFGSRTLNALKRKQADPGPRNYERLYARWGRPRKRSLFSRWFGWSGRLAQRLRWGHLLKE